MDLLLLIRRVVRGVLRFDVSYLVEEASQLEDQYFRVTSYCRYQFANL